MHLCVCVCVWSLWLFVCWCVRDVDMCVYLILDEQRLKMLNRYSLPPAAPSTPPVESALPSVDPAALNGSGGEGGSVDRKRRGSRTTLTPSQLQKLMQVYEYEARPTKETKLALSKATGLE